MSNPIYDAEEDQVDEVTHMTHEQYTEYKASCEHLVGLAKQSAKLTENSDFQAIVMTAYFEQEPIRLAGLMSTGRLTDAQFDGCVQDLKAIGSMRAFLQDFIQKGNIAQGELENLEIAWNEAVLDEAGEGESV